MGEIEVLNGPFGFLIFCLSVETRSEKGKLISKRFLLLTVKMAGIVPPFRFEFRMRKMILRKRKGSSRKSPFEFLAQKCRSKCSEG